MKTDDLVAALSTRIEPVNRHLMSWTMGIAFFAAALVALGLVLVGPRDPRRPHDGPRLDVSRLEACICGRCGWRLVDLFGAPGAAGRGQTNLVSSDHDAVRGDRSARSNQPWTRANLALGRDGHGRSMARMPALRSGYRDRAFRHHCRCDAKSRPDQSGTNGCFRRSHCRRRKCNGLCTSLHRRFTAVYCGLVRRNDLAVHLRRCSTSPTFPTGPQNLRFSVSRRGKS